uniref:Uncharacterized LOC113474990 n=1 Tax=Ciona intestinalis TaxID=7719 RepID=H2XTL4_CIOIN|nr:uncharacterized protein LOC113474990 [Ciona intestinalis]|eukprot:XP_026694075.1 uncharacterized protein LOC113474990 [Ciona intestinalis]
MTKKQSAVYCSNRSAELADIADRETYGLIYGHVAKHYKYQTLVYTYVHVWIASKYNSQTGKVAQSNGEPGFNGDRNWKQPGFPTSQSTSTELVMRVRYLHTNDSGLLNYPIGKEFEASTVLCSIKLSSDL